MLQWVVVDCQTSDMANARAISASTIVLAEAQAQIPNGIFNYVSQQMVLSFARGAVRLSTRQHTDTTQYARHSGTKKCSVDFGLFFSPLIAFLVCPHLSANKLLALALPLLPLSNLICRGAIRPSS